MQFFFSENGVLGIFKINFCWKVKRTRKLLLICWLSTSFFWIKMFWNMTKKQQIICYVPTTKLLKIKTKINIVYLSIFLIFINIILQVLNRTIPSKKINILTKTNKCVKSCANVDNFSFLIFRPRVAAVSINTVSLSLSLSLSVQKLFFLLRINICSVCVCVSMFLIVPWLLSFLRNCS